MLTDNEIMKALECCSDDFGKTCEGMHCPMIAECQVDTNALEKSALALINRQKAEIEKNEDIIRLADKTIEKQSAENERYLHSIKLLEKDVAQVKSEAYREFNARLYVYKTNIFIKGEELIIIPMSDFDKILKELTASNE